MSNLFHEYTTVKLNKMKIGLFFGTFNPMHIGHLIIANHVQQYSDLQEVWFVVTPLSPFKSKEGLANDNSRYYMVNKALEDYPNLKATNIEFNLPKPNYTTHTLAVLREKYPNYEFCLIMGEDNLSYLHKWKNSDFLTEEYKIYVYPRIHKDVKPPKVSMDNVYRVENAPIIEISATHIRNALKEKKNVRPLLPETIFNEIERSGLYSKK